MLVKVLGHCLGLGSDTCVLGPVVTLASVAKCAILFIVFHGVL